MIHLPQVTLFAIDTVHPDRTLRAMRDAMRHVEFAEAVLLTDTQRWRIGASNIRTVHHTESDRKVKCPRADHYPLPVDYEFAALVEPGRHGNGVKTSHVLFMEWDSGIANPWAWQERDGVTGHIWGDIWMSYDYIGSPWPPHHEPGWPACDGETNNVGNGGFSLRSVKYCCGTADALAHFKDDPMVKAGQISSDMHPCRTWRSWLEKEHGIKFAPEKIAARFSCENLPYSGQFGWHGQWTAELNGWGGALADVRPKGRTA